jgi:glycosyltransferase involved in cell wall biosynthesis
VNGLLVPENHVHAWAAAVERLVADDRTRRDLAVYAHARRRDFSVAAHADQLLALYREVLANPER